MLYCCCYYWPSSSFVAVVIVNVIVVGWTNCNVKIDKNSVYTYKNCLMFVCVAGRNDGYGRTQSDKRKILKLCTSPGTGMSRETLEDFSITGWYLVQQGIIWENHLKKVLPVWQSVESQLTQLWWHTMIPVLCCAVLAGPSRTWRDLTIRDRTKISKSKGRRSRNLWQC